MKKFNVLSTAKTVVFALLTTVLFISCSNSVSSEDEHQETEGFRLKMNGQTIVEQLPDGNITGEFVLEVGEETPLITIYFLDHDREEFQPDEPELSLRAAFEESGIAEFQQHAEDGKWSFHLHAEAEGETTMTLQLYHNDHPDFITQGIPVRVETPASTSPSN